MNRITEENWRASKEKWQRIISAIERQAESRHTVMSLTCGYCESFYRQDHSKVADDEDVEECGHCPLFEKGVCINHPPGNETDKLEIPYWTVDYLGWVEHKETVLIAAKKVLAAIMEDEHRAEPPADVDDEP